MFETRYSIRTTLALILIMSSLVTACGSSVSTRSAVSSLISNAKNSSTPSSLSLTAGSSSINPGESTSLTANGGTSPYKYSLYSGTGTVSGNYYYAGTTSGNSATVKVTDSSGSVAYVRIYIDSSLSLSFSSSTVSTSGSVILSGSGGTSPYNYTLVSGGGSITNNTYTAPAYSTTATVKITDQAGNSTTDSITVKYYAPLQITPNSVTLYVGDTITFQASGGSGSYNYALMSGSGALTGSTYTAPALTTLAKIQVWDSQGSSATASISVVKKSLLYTTAGFNVEYSALLVFNMPNDTSYLPSIAIGGAGSNGDFGRGVNMGKGANYSYFAPAPSSAAVVLTNFNYEDSYPYVGTLIVSARSSVNIFSFCIQSGDPNGHLKKVSVQSEVSNNYKNIKFESFATKASGGTNLQGLWLSAIDSPDSAGSAGIQIQAGGHNHKLVDCTGYSDFALISASTH